MMTLAYAEKMATFTCNACHIEADIEIGHGRPVGWGKLDFHRPGIVNVSHDLCQKCADRVVEFLLQNSAVPLDAEER